MNINKHDDLNSFSKVLYEANKNNNFLTMSYFLKNGNGVQATLTDDNGRYIEISNLPDEYKDVFNKSLKGESVISDVFYSEFLDKETVVIGVPIYYNGEIQGVLTASDDIEHLKDILNLAIKSDESNNYIHIIDKNGDFIIRGNRRIYETTANSIYSMGINLLDENEVTNALKSKKDYYSLFKLQGTQYAVYFSPLDNYKDWYIFCINPLIPKSSPTTKILYTTRLMFGLVILLIVLLIVVGYLMIKKSNNILTKLAYFDELTGAYNSTRFRDICEEKLKQNNNYSIFIFNIMKFKFLNDVFGEKGANDLLCYVKEILDKNICSNEYYCRYNADQFFVFIKSIDKNEILNRINKIKDDIALFSNIKNQNCDIKIYGGICNYIHSDNVSISYKTMVDNAYYIMKEAKKPKETFIFYDESICNDIYMKNFIESNMEKALLNREFKLFLQPKVNLKTKKIIGAEALVRWIRDDDTMIYPNDFIPLFEKNGFCEKLDLYMFERACEKIRTWMDKGIDTLSISVNQSKLLFYKADYLDNLCAITNKYKIPNSLITLEILERLSYDNIAELNSTINKLHLKGFKVSMDDFGSGYSSLNTLCKLQIDELKIDKNFLLEMKNDEKIEERQQIILNNIISLAKKLNIQTVIEGLEYHKHFEFVKELDCDIAQGYYFSKPLSSEDFDDKYINKNI